MKINRFIIFSIFVVFLFNSTFAFSHKAVGYKSERTLRDIELVEQYFSREYGVTLKKELTIHVTKTRREYKDILIKSGVKNARELADSAQAVTSNTSSVIIIDGSDLSDKALFFYLAHEMIHKYQFENIPEALDDYVLLEGLADVVASRISGYDIDIRDHGIPYEKLKSREQFFRSCAKDPAKTLEQIRFYVRNSRLPFKG